MATYGEGGLILRGSTWYARFYVRGREVRESLHTSDEETAKRRAALLRRKRDRGTYADPAQRRVTVNELLDDLLLNLEVRRVASLRRSRSHLVPVRLELGQRLANGLDTASIERVQQTWLAAGLAPATVNRRCELLRQAYRLALRRSPSKVVTAPHVPQLPMHNARQGFLAPDEILRLLEVFKEDDLRDYVEWASWTGMRPGEIRQLTWKMVDMKAGTLAVAPQVAKTRRGRTLALVGPLLEIMKRRLARRRLGCPLVFHRTVRGCAGSPVENFRKSWRAALRAAKLPLDLRPYDLRRTALRNLIRSGTHETVAMAISGHRTRSTFDRYNITSVDDVAAAIERVAKMVPGRARSPADRRRIGTRRAGMSVAMDGRNRPGTKPGSVRGGPRVSG